MMRVTYLGHSGFLIEMEDAYFLFDYYRGQLPGMDAEKKLLVFVSHAHYDHYRKEIFTLRDAFPRLRFILSSDIFVREAEDVVSMKPNEEREVFGCHIRTLRSTDEGVAFLIRYHGRTVYHAGDLNWWHWEGEPDPWNPDMEKRYRAEIETLRGERIDLAFVPVDPRLGEAYVLGLDCFMRTAGASHVFPMHCWDDPTVGERLQADPATEPYRERIVFLSRPGERWEG